jgi:hypothetical protein
MQLRRKAGAERPAETQESPPLTHGVESESGERRLRLPRWKRDANPGAPVTQERIQASAERLQRLEETLQRLGETLPDAGESPESPPPTRVRRGRRGGDAPASDGKSRHRPLRRVDAGPDAPASTGASWRQRRASKQAERESRASRLRRVAASAASEATGRAYERTGITVAGRQAIAHPVMLAVLGLVAYASLRGEVNWAQVHLGWYGLLAYVVPAVLDGAGISLILYALDRIDKGESGFGFRALSVALIGMGVWINWRNALPTGDVTREAFFPVMTGAAYLMVHLVMGAAKRDARRRQHGHKSKERPAPLPRFGVLVWVPGVGMPGRAFGALKEAIELRMLRSLAAASVSGDAAGGGEESADDAADAGETQDADTESGGESDTDADDAPSVPDLTGKSQTDAIRLTIDALGTHPLTVVSHLRTHGYPDLRPARVTDVLRRDAQRQAKTQADAGKSGADAHDAASVATVGE